MVMGLPMADVVLADDTMTIRIPLEVTDPETGSMDTVDVGAANEKASDQMIANKYSVYRD